MFRIMLALIAAAAPLTAGSAADRRYSVTDFDRIVVDGPWRVTLATGKAPSATATGSNGAIDRLSLEVEGRTLRIRRSTRGGFDDAGPVEIKVSTHDLRGASVNGPAVLAIDKARGLKLDLGLSGSGSLSLAQVEADNLVLGLVGSGRISVAGKAKSLRATIQGSGDLAAEGLSVDDANLTADTAGRIALAVRRTAKINATGQGEVEIIGSPACTVKAIGSALVRCGKN